MYKKNRENTFSNTYPFSITHVKLFNKRWYYKVSLAEVLNLRNRIRFSIWSKAQFSNFSQCTDEVISILKWNGGCVLLKLTEKSKEWRLCFRNKYVSQLCLLHYFYLFCIVGLSVVMTTFMYRCWSNVPMYISTRYVNVD